MKRIAAIAISFFMLSALFVPCVSAGLSAVPEDGSFAVSALLEFSEEMHGMIGNCSDSVTKGAPDDPYNSARLIVKTSGKPDTSGSLGHAEGWNNRVVLQYASPAEAREAAERLNRDPLVSYAVPDTEYRLGFTAGSPAPIDIHEFNSWGYGEDHVNMAALWERVMAKYGGNASSMPEIVVAVCDSGVNVSHEFLAGRTVQGYDFVNNDTDPSDGFGHGTFCAGVIADGTLPNVRIMPLKCISDQGYFSTSDVVSAVEYAYLHGCAAANLSLIEYNPYVEALYEEVINAAVDAGMVCCVASGNWAGNASDYVPGKIERSFTVAAHDSAHALWPLSNVGDPVDITAPGVDILSTLNTGGMDIQSGTSFAAPHAAACCAMIKTYDPGLGADEIMALLKANAIPEAYTGGGAGRLYVGSLFADGPQSVLPGDADGDGAVTVSDALIVLRFSMGLIGASDLNANAADIDGDGEITVSDALIILRTAMGLRSADNSAKHIRCMN